MPLLFVFLIGKDSQHRKIYRYQGNEIHILNLDQITFMDVLEVSVTL